MAGPIVELWQPKEERPGCGGLAAGLTIFSLLLLVAIVVGLFLLLSLCLLLGAGGIVLGLLLIIL